MRILFVEDEVNARGGLTGILQHMGHVVDYAESADEAVAKLQKQEYGLILLDIMMEPGDSLPGVPFRMSGLELLTRLRRGVFGELKTSPDVPVVVITAVSDMDVGEVLNGEAKANLVILKPKDTSDILVEIGDLLEKGDEHE